MGDLILYLGITLVGYILGSRLRSVRQNLGWTGKVQLVALVILVLLMGMRMGSNEEVTANISTIGVSAFLMTVVIMSFSVAAIWLARHVMKIDRYGRLQDGAAAVEMENVPEQTIKKTREESPAETAEEEKKGGNSKIGRASCRKRV